MIDFITKAYVLKNFAADAFDFVKEQVSDIGVPDIDAERWLHKVGLGYYKPGKSAAGGASLFFLGALVGGVLGLVFARQPGVQLRANIRDRAKGMLREAELKKEEISRGAQASFDQPRV